MKLFKPFKLPVVALPALAARGIPAAYSFLFPSGSAASIAEAASVAITPYKHWSSTWFWWCARHGNLAGQRPSFLVPKADRNTAPAAGERLAVWAARADTDAWSDFSTVTVGATYIEFQHASAFTSRTIYIASLPMYPFSRTQRVLAAWATADARLVNTPSTTGFILGYATARNAGDGSGRTAPALPFYGFKITNPSGFAKNKAILTSGNHPSETTGRFAFEGALNWLLGGSPEAEFLLDWFELYCYPCLNPQGVWAGYSRSCPQDTSLDHNRQWNTTAVLECIDAFKAAFAADTGGAIAVHLDYHSNQDADTVWGAVLDNTDPVHVAYAAKMASLEAGYDQRNYNIAGMLHKLLVDDYGADLSVVVEQGGANTRTIADFKTSGANSLKAVANLLAGGHFTNGPSVGSRDFNGTTDRIDWSSIANLTGHALTISFWANPDAIPANGYFLCIHDSGDTSFGIIINVSTGGYIGLLVNGATDLQRSSDAGAVAAGAWTQLTLTWDGVISPATGVQIYKNGAEVSGYSVTTGGASETTHSGRWSIGGRYYDDTRNFNGKLAQVGVWSRRLNSAEIAGLAAGQAPNLAAPTGLEFYFKGDTSSLNDEITATAGAADGTSQLTGVGNGPPVIY